MQIAPLPDNETERLAAVRSYSILDGPREAAIDALVRAAAQICEMPIALVTLLDSHRQWFLSCSGLTVTETSREIAFCGHAILRPHELLEIPDALQDERFYDNPLVTGEPKVRFYAGVPLVDAAGFALGTLCVLDHVPRSLTSAQRQVLYELSRAVVKLIEARRTQHAHDAAQRQNTLLLLAEEMAQLAHFRVDVCAGRTLWSDYVRDLLDWRENRPLLFADFIAAQHPMDRPAMAKAWQDALQHGTAFDLDSRVLRGDSELRYVHVKARCERDPATGRVCVVFGMLQDITERTRMRERSLHQSGLIATGTLAAGVGHEINNPLTYVAGNLELASDRLQRGPLSAERVTEIVGMLQEASDGALRIRDIVRGLRTFARSEEALRPTDVRSALDVALSMARHELRHRATLHDVVSANLPPVQANEARLSQVFLNLLVNAAQSFEDNDPTRNQVYIRAFATGKRAVVIEIEDNGSGIPPELQSRIFDPFFTTKRLGEGTGLGLSISHSLVTSLHGEITCQSHQGRGTTFRVTLPTASQEVGAAPPALRKAPGAAARRARLLVIDDEPAIARSMQHVLGAQHTVTICVDPREACALLERAPDAFDVVFCDLRMPFMTGMELYERATARQPALARRFVFMTGASIDQEITQFLSTAHNPPLEKPFSLEPLAAIVERVLLADSQGAA